MQYHLAQINIGRILGPMDGPVMAGFVAQLDEINQLADNSPGFIWRLQTDSGNATEIKVFEDEWIIVNMSVWENIEALKNYVYYSAHAKVLRDRKQWFERMETPFMALWWIPVGHIPTALEGKERVEKLTELGPTPQAFTFKQPFPAPTALGETSVLGSV